MLAVLNSVLLGLPVFFVNGVAGDDPMALWLLQQPSIVEGETQSADALARPAPSAPAATIGPPAVATPVVSID